MYSDLNNLCIEQDRSILEAVTRMETSKIGIVLVVDENQRLVGTVTDGDVRRALLANVDLDGPVSSLLAKKESTPYALPITGMLGADPKSYLHTLKQHSILHLPIVDSDGRVAGLVTLDEFVQSEKMPVRALIMAGGAGVRLRPLTEGVPKSMLPIGNRPLMEIIIDKLREAGIRRVHVTTHHNGSRIIEHFGDGKEFGVELTYVAEERPLGTAGGLRLMESPKETMLVINGDILTQVDFRSMLAFHRELHADLTVGVRHYDLKLPYGVIECEGISVRRLTEKPTLGFLVNAGIYLLEPCVHDFIPNGERFDMTDLIQRLLAEGRNVVSFPIREYWLDIGLPDDYEQAQNDMKQGKLLK